MQDRWSQSAQSPWFGAWRDAMPEDLYRGPQSIPTQAICRNCGAVSAINASRCGACDGPVLLVAHGPRGKAPWPLQLAAGLHMAAGLLILFFFLAVPFISPSNDLLQIVMIGSLIWPALLIAGSVGIYRGSVVAIVALAIPYALLSVSAVLSLIVPSQDGSRAAALPPLVAAAAYFVLVLHPKARAYYRTT